MLITVAICTWNRADLLEQTLSSLCALDTPEFDEWELLVVNNNCTDHTDACLNKFSSKLPLKRLYEPTQGHVPSRNRAIEHARGKLLVWTDDDVLVYPDWLNAYASAVDRYPQARFFGGEIEPLFESPPPPWLETNWQRCAGIYATRSLGEESFTFDKRKLPFGANFAVHTELQRKFRYDTRFGRVSDESVRGFDEIDVLRQLLDAGHQGYWIPQAKLKHFIPTSRMTLDYVRKYYEGQGETWAIRGERAMSNRQLVSEYLTHQSGYVRDRLLRRTSNWFGHLVEASRARGQLRFQRRQAKAASIG